MKTTLIALILFFTAYSMKPIACCSNKKFEDYALEKFEEYMSYEVLSIFQQLHLNEDSKNIIDKVWICTKNDLEQQFQIKFGISLQKLKKRRQSHELDAYGSFKITIETLAGTEIENPFNYSFNEETKQKLQDIEQVCFSKVGYDIQKAEANRMDKNLISSNITIKFPNYTAMKRALIDSWSTLYHKKNVAIPNDSSSLLNIRFPFVLPGGRFREFYYWDSYWIILGLLYCDEIEMALLSVQNFIDLIDKNGYIPNGARKYYLNRSQPPYFTLMLKELYDFGIKTKNFAITNFIQEKGVPAALQEYKWWQSNRNYVDNTSGHALSRYYVETTFPRPESFKEDLKTFVERLEEEKIKKPDILKDPQLYLNLQRDVYSNIKSAAESGWDFSTRWFDETNQMRNIRTRKIIPTYLNAILYKTEVVLADFLDIVHDTRAKEMRDNAKKRKLAINYLLWNPKMKIWNDFDVETEKHVTKRMYFSNVMPLLYGIRHPDVSSKEVLNGFLFVMNKYEGGIPTSSYDANHVNETQQWDFPNVWPPFQDILVSYLYKDNFLKAREIALKYMKSVFHGFPNKQVFYEKYHCINVGAQGEGGEYHAQIGFGWTNGIALKFMDMFGDEDLANELEQ